MCSISSCVTVSCSQESNSNQFTESINQLPVSMTSANMSYLIKRLNLAVDEQGLKGTGSSSCCCSNAGGCMFGDVG